MSKYIDEKLLRQGLSAIQKDGQIMEIRTIKGREIYSMVTKSADQVIKWLRWMEKEDPASNKRDMLEGRNIYVTVNTLAEDCYSLPQHEKLRKIGSGEGVNDPDVTRLDNIVVDLDPIRRSHISASDAEKEKAFILARKVSAYLKARGWPDPILADSGNGYHLRYRIALENIPEHVKLVENVLKSLDLLFSNSAVDIDTSVFNPSRILKLYGTLAQKGSNTSARPHRMSKVLFVPGEWREVSKQQMQTLVDEVLKPVEEAQQADSEPKRKAGKEPFNVCRFLDDHGVTYKERTWQNSRVLALDHCVFNPDHCDGDAKVFIHPDGSLGYKCWHNSCQGYHWRDARLKLDPQAYDHPADQMIQRQAKKKAGNGNRDPDPEQIPDISDEKLKSILSSMTVFDADRLAGMEFEPISYPVDSLIPVGSTVLAGAPKMGKSWFCLDMAVSVAMGAHFLGAYGFLTKKNDVIYLALEDSEQFAQERLKKVLANRPAPEGLHLVFNGIRTIEDGLFEQLDALLRMYPKTKMIIIDTLAFVSGSPRRGESAYSFDYRVGSSLKKFADARKLSVVLVTHTTKLKNSDDFLVNISGTNGTSGAADCTIVLNKEKRTDKDASLFICGRRVEMRQYKLSFNPDTCVWTSHGAVQDGEEDAEALERKHNRLVYLNDDIREGVIAIAKNNKSWVGSANELREKAAQYGVGLTGTNKQIGLFLCSNIGLFMKEDRIHVWKISNGTGANKYRISEWSDISSENEALPLITVDEAGAE